MSDDKAAREMKRVLVLYNATFRANVGSGMCGEEAQSRAMEFLKDAVARHGVAA